MARVSTCPNFRVRPRRVSYSTKRCRRRVHGADPALRHALDVQLCQQDLITVRILPPPSTHSWRRWSIRTRTPLAQSDGPFGADDRFSKASSEGPSRTTEYFATTHLRAKTGVGVVLHLG